MSSVFSDITDTPILNAGWTVQSGGPAGNQSLVSGSGSTGGGVGLANPNGFLVQSFSTEDIALVSGGGVVLVDAQLQGVKLIVEDAITTTSGAFVCGATAATTHAFLFLMDSNGNVIETTGDIGGSGASYFCGTAGFEHFPWSNGAVTLEAGVYFGGLGFHSGSAPKVMGPTNPQTALNYNLGQHAGAAAYRFWSVGSAIGNSGYAGPVTMTSIANDTTIQPFFALI